MKAKSILHPSTVLENIKYHFDFLFHKGFRIVSVLFCGPDDANWQILLTAGDHLVNIHSHGERVGLALSSLEMCDEIGLFELKDTIRLIHGDEGPPDILDHPQDDIQGFSEMAKSLETYMEDIWIYIGEIHLAVSMSKSGQLFLNNCPDFFIEPFLMDYSFTSPSITSP